MPLSRERGLLGCSPERNDTMAQQLLGNQAAYRAMLNVTERSIVAPEIGLPMKGRRVCEQRPATATRSRCHITPQLFGFQGRSRPSRHSQLVASAQPRRTHVSVSRPHRKKLTARGVPITAGNADWRADRLSGRHTLARHKPRHASRRSWSRIIVPASEAREGRYQRHGGPAARTPR
jgi:hypothetical protein